MTISFPDTVFNSSVEQARISHRVLDAETDPVVGGSCHFKFEDHDRRGKFGAVEPGRKLEYDWDFGIGKTDAGFALGTDPEGTRWREMHDKGWESFLINLKSVIEDGRDRRAEQFGLLRF